QLFNSLFVIFALKDALDKSSRQMDLIRIEVANFHQLFHLGDGDVSGHRRQWIKVACRFAKNQIAELIALPSLNKCKIPTDGLLQDVFSSVKVTHFLALGHQSPHARRRVKGRDTSPS